MTDQEKQRIDSMSQFDMAHMWRFSPTGEPLLQGDTGDYFSKVFREKGGFTPEISKRLGWER